MTRDGPSWVVLLISDWTAASNYEKVVEALAQLSWTSDFSTFRAEREKRFSWKPLIFMNSDSSCMRRTTRRMELFQNFTDDRSARNAAHHRNRNWMISVDNFVNWRRFSLSKTVIECNKSDSVSSSQFPLPTEFAFCFCWFGKFFRFGKEKKTELNFSLRF